MQSIAYTLPEYSGQFEGTNRHISKRGSAYLRRACYEVMHSLKVHKPEFEIITDKPYIHIQKNVVKYYLQRRKFSCQQIIIKIKTLME